MKFALHLYHSTPAFLWPVLASAKSLLLKRRRYGKIYARAVPAIQERTSWPREAWKKFQEEQLGELLDRAASRVPAYMSTAVAGSGRSGLERLNTWPLVDLDHFRNNPEAYVDPEFGLSRRITLYTSGSTGTPKKIIRDRRAEELNYAYMEARWLRTAGVSASDRWVMIGGQLVVPVTRKRPPFWVPAYPTQQLYMSSYHLQDEYAEHYMAAIRRWSPAYILGYASSLEALARFSEKTGIRVTPKAILSNAEPLYAHVRERLERVFSCSVRDTYGGTEGAFQGFECNHGSLHISPDFGVFEILREDGTPCGPGELGRAVVTGLTNRAMPLIRYPTGDLVAWARQQDCECGCTFPVISVVEGRSDDVIELPSGRRVGRLDPAFKGDLPIREAQIIQRVDYSIDVLVVPEINTASGRVWKEEHAAQLVLALRERLGPDLPVNVRLTDRIPRAANNKFRAVVREKRREH